ncbi:hypothetical protein L3i22_061890 [Actinoplanes sp. L3-i22]|nr:hypothetical protein [Actinoplanes sp. L3-i22]BCY11101.1 hypothetical protein L3i22_061890 [Actinoplanes sp. L3-i22]
MSLRSLNHAGGKLLYSVGRLDIMSGQGQHLLKVSTEVSADWLAQQSDTAQVLVTGEVWCANAPSAPWLGALVPQVQTFRLFTTSTWFAVQVTDDQLIALDKARDNKTLDLRVDVKSTLLHPGDGFYPVAEDQFTASVDEPEWTKLLDRVGVLTGFLIRVAGPFHGQATYASQPHEEDQASLTQAIARLRQARAELAEGRWEACTATCRRVLENLQRIAQPLPTAKSIRTAPDPEKLNEDERWAALFYAVKALTQPAHHDDHTTLAFTFTREKSEAALAATASLLNVYTAG